MNAKNKMTMAQAMRSMLEAAGYDKAIELKNRVEKIARESVFNLDSLGNLARSIFHTILLPAWNEDEKWIMEDANGEDPYKVFFNSVMKVREFNEKAEVWIAGREKKFTVRVEWVVTKDYEVTGTDAADAVRKINEKVDNGEVCVWTDGFEASDEKDQPRVYAV